VWERPFNQNYRSIVSKNGVLHFSHKDQTLISLELASASQASTLNMSQLLAPKQPSINQLDLDVEPANIIQVMPLKSKLMALVRVKNQPRIVFLR
ncbi:MAG: hypothetical protein VW397_04740, partial [Candidatus Margulisiibacteriota bacterium]